MSTQSGSDLPSVALSIQQPWAWAIVHGGKTIENRTWRTRFRGRFLIHASGKYDTWGTDTVSRLCPAFPGRKNVLLGGIIGEAELIGCVTSSTDEWFCGPFGFILRNARPLSFVPCRGQLGLFEVKL